MPTQSTILHHHYIGSFVQKYDVGVASIYCWPTAPTCCRSESTNQNPGNGGFCRNTGNESKPGSFR